MASGLETMRRAGTEAEGRGETRTGLSPKGDFTGNIKIREVGDQEAIAQEAMAQETIAQEDTAQDMTVGVTIVTPGVAIVMIR